MKSAQRSWFYEAFRLLLAGLIGGIGAIGLTVLVLAINDRYSPNPPPGYMNPSAAVGSAVETVIRAAVIFAFGVFGGVLVRWYLRRR